MSSMGRSKARGAVLASVVVLVGLASCGTDPEATPTPQPIQSAPNCGRLTTPCEAGGACETAADCKSSACREGKCQDVVPPDGQQNNGETDIDCGGTKAVACDDGKKCAIAADCKSGVCTGAICQVPSPTDGVKNGDETGKDCGGTKAPKCAAGEGCASTADCLDVKCDDATKKCGAPTHDDGFKNGDETGVDCGGPTATQKCPPGQGCIADTDCDDTRCDTTGAKTCNPPAANDNLQNGTETDVDCGGGAPTNARRCKDGATDGTSEKCDVDGDCASGFCSFAKRCVTARSCKGTVGMATAGIATCGRYESTNAAKQHESCCRSLPLPTTTTVRLDKYEVTAGRFRQFIESIPNGNIRQWAKDEITNATPTAQRLSTDLDATMIDLLPASQTPGEALNLVQQIGATVMAPDLPSKVQGCYQDYVSTTDGAYGANTYYWDHATLKAHFGNSIKPRLFTKAQYDEKSINCAPYWMYAAFCAWDGGRLPTPAEVYEAYGSTYYPWNSNTYGLAVPGAGQTYEDVSANYYNNGLYFYGFPAFADARDSSGYIAAPGRFIKDKTFLTSANGESWMDLGANMMEVTRYNNGAITATCGGGTAPCQQGSTTFCDTSLGTNAGTPNLGNCTVKDPFNNDVSGTIRATNMPSSIWVGGSWEGHYAFGHKDGLQSADPELDKYAAEPYFQRNSYNFRVPTQYGKTGVRCAR
jgi:hypothetical protein